MSRTDRELTYLNKLYGAPKNYLWGTAIAPYINLGGSQTTEGLTKAQVLSALSGSVDAYQNGVSITNAVAKAAEYGLRLEAYEGGIDTFGTGSIAAKAAAVLDPQIQDIMTRYLNVWYSKGGDQFNWFTIGARSYNSQYGTWSITDSYSRLDAPKILAYQQVRDAVPVNVTSGIVYG